VEARKRRKKINENKKEATKWWKNIKYTVAPIQWGGQVTTVGIRD
jgi:hypothetical protein